ncbi:MAG: ribonuclease H-like domain-containing protein [Bacteroidales bacterium]|nr:ribonuclease H-like domain-containing protein [Bacteroidales bacterium]
MVLTFDIETKKLADEVGGWNNIHKMGVACLVVLDSRNLSYHVFSPDDVPDTKPLIQVVELFDSALNEGRIINGYNILNFDFIVLEHELGIKNLKQKYKSIIVDPMQHIYEQLGFRVSLQDIVSLNFNDSKLMDAKKAPMEWRKGNYQKVIDYCKKDVEFEYKLYLKGKKEKMLLYKSKFDPQPRKLKVNWK